MKEYYIRPIAITKGPRSLAQFTHRLNYDKMCEICNCVWDIEGAEPKTLIDTGADADLVLSRLGIQGQHIQTLEEGLGNLGLTFSDIERVIVTHLNWDHVAYAKKFTRAKFIVQKRELDFAINPHPYIASTYEKSYFTGLDFQVVDGYTEIDDGIRVMLTPGHTPGGQSVVIRTPAGTAVVAGFCSIMVNFLPPQSAMLQGKPVNPPGKGLPVTPPGLHINVLEVYDSALRVKQTADIIVAPHDTCFIGKSRIPEA